MEMALYHPHYGYYAANRGKIGAHGDFLTSPHLAVDFGELLAKQFAEMWQILGQPQSFTLVEIGAGQGLLAADVLSGLQRHHPDCFACLDYVIVEKAAALMAEQQQRLKSWQAKVKIEWRSLDEIPAHSITGCVFSNELIDAFPVHLVTLTDRKLQEIYVTAQPNGFAEVIDEPSTSRLTDYFDLNGIDLFSPNYPDGYRTEVNLAALDWLSLVCDRIQRGYILTIDYGYTATRYYNPRRSQGTLQCYYQHSHHNNPYINVGQQDITAHVDFTALEGQGDRCGLKTLGFTQQGLFLMALGLSDRLTALSQIDAKNAQDIQNAILRRDALHQLMNPMGLGNFGVLIQSKGLTKQETERPLIGLREF
ncbi:class I SAM-dependent methyltransferase [Phormidesmis priestleyi ULC007]|uniref:Class I SAM-dependent methyltransferase n=2 Tax=Phormidesmis priestleyi TaxID=268141 RepID=A0A2T1DP03_9CYAN|nr:class I SAM-dependent methyltransferase [Phormidesmis priestleyi ULC007]PZO52564.1 MAG: class I SAM-dependent methyltransferase [Phormidesmis priestleyi]